MAETDSEMLERLKRTDPLTRKIDADSTVSGDSDSTVADAFFVNAERKRIERAKSMWTEGELAGALAYLYSRMVDPRMVKAYDGVPSGLSKAYQDVCDTINLRREEEDVIEAQKARWIGNYADAVIFALDDQTLPQAQRLARGLLTSQKAVGYLNPIRELVLDEIANRFTLRERAAISRPTVGAFLADIVVMPFVRYAKDMAEHVEAGVDSVKYFAEEHDLSGRLDRAYKTARNAIYSLGNRVAPLDDGHEAEPVRALDDEELWYKNE